MAKEKMENLNIKVPKSWKAWLKKRASRTPGLGISDVVRMIIGGEIEREARRRDSETGPPG